MIIGELKDIRKSTDLPPSREGGGKTAGFDGGREKVKLQNTVFSQTTPT